MMPAPAQADAVARPTAEVVRTDDFAVTGKGDHAAWDAAAFVELPPLPREAVGRYPTQFKLLYSDTGLYVFMTGKDTAVTAAIREDFGELWKQDVYEFFLWTNEAHPVYFEYEISPHGHELPILITRIDGRKRGWRPWQYEGARKVQKAVHIQREGDAVTGWSAEVFVPWALIEPLGNCPPVKGTVWRANFYRMDYDDGRPDAWAWTKVGNSFHEIEKFGTLRFE